MNQQDSLLPPDFYNFIKVSALMGFISFGILMLAAVYLLFKKIFGDEKAKKYRWLFIIISVFIELVLIFIYILVFNSPKVDLTNSISQSY